MLKPCLTGRIVTYGLKSLGGRTVGVGIKGKFVPLPSETLRRSSAAQVDIILHRLHPVFGMVHHKDTSCMPYVGATSILSTGVQPFLSNKLKFSRSISRILILVLVPYATIYTSTPVLQDSKVQN
jgi:hypothetical protein